MDYNIDASIGTEVYASSFGDGLLQHNRAYLDWLDEIQVKYPHLILESCAGGALRIDYASLAHCALYSISDQLQCTEMAHTAQPCFEEKLFCAGIEAGEQTYLKVWRWDTEESTLCIPVTEGRTRIIYPSEFNG